MRIHVIAFGQRIAGIQLSDRATIPHASRYQTVRDGLIHGLFNVGKQTGHTGISLRNFGGAGVKQVIEVGLNVVLQPVEPVALVEEVTVRHDTLLQDRRVVGVVHEHVRILRIHSRRLSYRQRFVGYARFLFEFQGNGGIAAVEIDSKRATES